MKRKLTAAALTAALLLSPVASRAHCDAVDGPVITTARNALDTGEIAPVLAWVRAQDEKQIRAEFSKALAARKKSGASHDATDRKFFETLVRVHRAGEGAPYTGIKPAGAGVTPAIRAADAAVASRDGAQVEEMLTGAVKTSLHERFEKLQQRQPPGKDVAAGREWVAAYVDYIHHVERLEAAAHASGHDEHASAPAPVKHAGHDASAAEQHADHAARH